MPEQIQKILNRIMEWWKKFNTKQKAILISSTAVVLIALVILGVSVSRPTYVPLVTCEDTAKAAEVKTVKEVIPAAVDLSWKTKKIMKIQSKLGTLRTNST